MCNKAAKKKGIIPATGSLQFSCWPGKYEYPQCDDTFIDFDDAPGSSNLRVVNCSSKESMYFSISKGQSNYGAYEFECFQRTCTAKGNIGSVFV